MTDEKHYNTFNNYLKNRFHHKVFKVSLNAGMTCPNRDGTKSNIGCLYCSELLSGDFAGNVLDSFQVQFEKIKNMELKKWNEATYIAYLQAGSNTYNKVDTLKEIYQTIINLDSHIEILDIATRPDCINKEIVDLLKEINKQKEVWIELGLQSASEKTLKFINTCYSLKDFEQAIKLLNEANIKTIVHIIDGLPYETKDDMLNTIKYLNQFDLFGIKIHMLHLLKNTPLLEIYNKEQFHILTLTEYVEIVTSQLRLLKPSIIIHRLTGDGKKEDLVKPLWTLKKFVVLNEIDKYLRKYNYYQGDLWKE